MTNFRVSHDFPQDISINPNTNMLYVSLMDLLNDNTGKVYVIDGKTNRLVTNISVGLTPSRLAINPVTNTVYVTNMDSDTLSIINGTTNKLMAGVKFDIKPSNAGDIYCNNKEVLNNYTRFYVNSIVS